MRDDDSRPRGVDAIVWLLEHGQDYVSAVVGLILLVMAIIVLGGALGDFGSALGHGQVETGADNLLDRILLTLILTEIVHTVVLSLRAHHLVAQPLVVVGLLATIRKVLFVLSSPSSIPTATFALLLAMVVVFVAAFLLVGRFSRAEEQFLSEGG
jgi:uncharacterized membrane protein (DUF373 family)